jgi:hypothetical protein
MRFFPPGKAGAFAALPTPSEAFVQERFGRGGAAPFSLAQRIGAFMARPLAADLNARFPEIAAIGAEADALTEMRGNTRVIFKLIVGEAIIAAGGGTRSQVRGALPD